MNKNRHCRIGEFFRTLCVLLSAGVPVARGGFVFFDPELAVVDASETPETLSFELHLRAFLPAVEQFRVLAGSNGVPFTDFVPADEGFSWTLGAFSGIYNHGVLVEGNTGELFPFPPELHLGRLTVSTADLEMGEHRIIVDWAFDGGFSQAALRGFADPLIGVARIVVVPEPACGILLIVGGAALVLRRGRKNNRAAVPPASRNSCPTRNHSPSLSWTTTHRISNCSRPTWRTWPRRG